MEERPNLDETKTDLAVSFAKGVFGAVPYIGGIVAEVTGTLIPRQRLDRVTEFLQILDAMVTELQREVLEQKMKTEEFIDLFEDAVWQAARARSRNRKEWIAAVLKHSLYEGEINHIRSKELLALLNELNDAQIIILKSKSFELPGPAQEAFYEQHRAVLQAPLVSFSMVRTKTITIASLCTTHS